MPANGITLTDYWLLIIGQCLLLTVYCLPAQMGKLFFSRSLVYSEPQQIFALIHGDEPLIWNEWETPICIDKALKNHGRDLTSLGTDYFVQPYKKPALQEFVL